MNNPKSYEIVKEGEDLLGDHGATLFSDHGQKMKSVYAGRKLREEIAAEAGREDLSGLTPEEAYPEAYAP